eukprot:Platyproteum_vivax@DN6245_c0_g1_i3.p1
MNFVNKSNLVKSSLDQPIHNLVHVAGRQYRYVALQPGAAALNCTRDQGANIQHNLKRNIVAEYHSQPNSPLTASYPSSNASSAESERKLTHFLSVPLTQEPIQKRHQKFMAEVLSQPDLVRSLDGEEVPLQEWLMKPAMLHFTLFMLSLPTKLKVELAKAAFLSVENEVTEICRRSPLKLELEGLYCMGSPGNTSVVYTAPKETCEFEDTIHEITGILMKAYHENGVDTRAQIMKDSKHHSSGDDFTMNLHATLMNTKYGPQKGRKMDASKLVQKLGDFDFGSTLVSGLDLSYRFGKGPQGYYQQCAEIVLPVEKENE